MYFVVDMWTFLELERRRPYQAQHNLLGWAQTDCQAASMPSLGYKRLIRGTLERKRHILSVCEHGPLTRTFYLVLGGEYWFTCVRHPDQPEDCLHVWLS